MIVILTRRMDDQSEAEKIKAALRQTRGTREYARVVTVNIVYVNRQSPTFAAKMLGIDRGTVSDWLDADARNGLNDLADDAGLGRRPLVPRAKLEKKVDEAKRFTAYEFVGLVKKKTDMKYSESHRRRLLRSLGFAVKKTLDIRPRPVQRGAQNLAERCRKGGRSSRKRRFYARDGRRKPPRFKHLRFRHGLRVLRRRTKPDAVRQPAPDHLRRHHAGYADVLHSRRQGHDRLFIRYLAKL